MRSEFSSMSRSFSSLALAMGLLAAGAAVPGTDPARGEDAIFRRGDANGDGILDVSDPIRTLFYLFNGGVKIECLEAADSDDSGALDLSDAVYGLTALFLGGPLPPAPGPFDCGPDPSIDDLGCEAYGAPVCSYDIAAVLFQAVFRHDHPDAPYLLHIEGSLDVRFIEDAPGIARAILFIPPSGSFLAASWILADVASPPAAGPAAIALAGPMIDGEALDVWTAGGGGPDPGLAIPLEPIPNGGSGSWTNSEEVAGQAFLLGCGAAGHRRLADVRIEKGGLNVIEWRDERGMLQVKVTGVDIALKDPAPSAWQEILAGCGGSNAGLPGSPAPGKSTRFDGSSQQAPLPQGTIHGQIESMRSSIADLVAGNELDAASGASLDLILEQACGGMRSGSPDDALAKLGEFRSALDSLVKNGELSPNAAGPLYLRLDTVMDSIGELIPVSTSPLPEPSSYCDPAPPMCPIFTNCTPFATYYVAQGSTQGGDGSSNWPFRLINEALDAAKAANLCRVEVRVAAGTYAEDVPVAMPTRIVGESSADVTIGGTVSNLGPYPIEISGVAILPPSGEGVLVDNACATTTLFDVRIDGARRYGIRHRGGSLQVHSATVSRTRADAEYFSRGTGIYLTCGVQANLILVDLVQNESKALIAVDEGTSVTGGLVGATDTGHNPDFTLDEHWRGEGAILVGGGAQLNLAFVRLSRNDLEGLVASGTGSRAILKHITVEETRSVTMGTARTGGIAILAVHGGEVELTDFHLTSSGTAGIVIATGSGVDLHDGEVSGNPIGAHIADPGYCLSRLMDNVIWDNDRNLDMEELPVPDSGIPED